MEQTDVEKGMLVRLKSGGPAMVVRALSGTQAYCEWFTDVHRRQGTFELATLVPVPEGESGASQLSVDPGR